MESALESKSSKAQLCTEIYGSPFEQLYPKSLYLYLIEGPKSILKTIEKLFCFQCQIYSLVVSGIYCINFIGFIEVKLNNCKEPS